MLYLTLPIESIEQISLANEVHLRRAGCKTLGDAIDLDRKEPWGLERANVTGVGAGIIRRLAKEWSGKQH